ncbi:thioesterase-like superfamily-domain-containing protein [Podospora appendiculata]|uniref:Thioesterase-like superfamily-domain-containing protein n=1 Tax=Podospora appendiculata TaxID=314037 RepID=A0AAE0WYU2_9PEZI|nr:thioesterase-like superfamily-domain-containing protein [Podospora appendiculata]
MAGPDDPRQSFQEAMSLIEVASPAPAPVRRFMGTRAAYLPGSDLKLGGIELPRPHKAAFGGHVYAQSSLAACRVWSDLENQKGTLPSDKLGLHTIHGYFTAMGVSALPFIYDITPLTASRTLGTVSITARQPSVPSTNPANDFFPAADAALPLADPCFVAICSFKLAEPHSAGVSMQEDPPQTRFASILASRSSPQAWPPAPPVDIDAMVAMAGSEQVGWFPAVDMKKVDMTAYNDGKPVHERRELMLYRLLRPLPVDAEWDANAHVVVHAFAADRNGLLMTSNHVGFGWSVGKVASVSNSFVVHVDAAQAVMGGDDDGWWVQEASFPRAGSGRGIVMNKIWSPRGVHVATEYQDGLVRAFEEREERPEKGKL